jgi:hypothetical protein
MTTSAAHTESCVDEAIAGCLGVDYEYGQAVTTHMTMPLRFDVLRSAAELHIDDLGALDELDVLLGRLKEAFDKRNAVVHHMWCRDPETGNIVMVKERARVRVEVKSIPMSADQVKVDALFVRRRNGSFLVSQGTQFAAAVSYRAPAALAQEQGGTEETSRA